MNVRPDSLSGTQGELVSVHISIEPRLVEQLLDALAYLDFPINPELRHLSGSVTTVEFPAWSSQIPRIREALAHGGFDPGAVEVCGMLREIRSAGATAA